MFCAGSYLHLRISIRIQIQNAIPHFFPLGEKYQLIVQYGLFIMFFTFRSSDTLKEFGNKNDGGYSSVQVSQKYAL
jgi:hypothetical protein